MKLIKTNHTECIKKKKMSYSNCLFTWEAIDVVALGSLDLAIGDIAPSNQDFACGSKIAHPLWTRCPSPDPFVRISLFSFLFFPCDDFAPSSPDLVYGDVAHNSPEFLIGTSTRNSLVFGTLAHVPPCPIRRQAI
jgi:hypothetical protein